MKSAKTGSSGFGKALMPGLFLVAAVIILIGITVWADDADSAADTSRCYVSGSAVYDPYEWMDEDGNLTAPSQAYPADDGYTGYWILLCDNIWLYTFYVDDDEASYYVWEDEVEGYASNYTLLNPYQLSDAAEIAEIVNTCEDISGSGALQISLEVSDADGNSVESDASFAVRVTLKDSEGNSPEGTAVYGEYAFSEGIAMVTLTQAEEVFISDIPEGYIWYIEAVNTGDYSVSYSQQEGEIEADETAAAVITAFEPETEYVDLTFAKEIDGFYESTDDVYSLKITLDGLESLETYEIVYSGEVPEGSAVSVAADEEGKAECEIYLKAGGSAVLCAVPEGTVYTAAESAGEYTASYEIADNNETEGFVYESGKNSEEDEELSTSERTAAAGEDVVVTFTNYLYRTQDVSITVRSLNGSGESREDDETVYEIEVSLEGLKEDAQVYVLSSLSQEEDLFYASSSGEFLETFEMAAGETLTLKDLPVGSTYTITQKANDSKASYTITDVNSLGMIVLSADTNENADQALSTQKETVNEGEEVTVIFTNRAYKAKVVIYKASDEGGVEGAVYDIYRILDDGSSECVAQGISTGADGYTQEVESLTAGNYYVQETYAPEGYFIAADVAFEISEEDLGGTKTVSVSARRLVSLVSAGGVGIYVFLAAGIFILLAISVFILVKSRRRG